MLHQSFSVQRSLVRGLAFMEFVKPLPSRSEDFRVLTVTNRESVVTISRSEGIDLRDVPMHSSDAVIHRSFKNWPISLTAHDLLSCGQKWLVWTCAPGLLAGPRFRLGGCSAGS